MHQQERSPISEVILQVCLQDCLRLYAYGLVCQLFLLTAYLTCFQRLHRHTAAGDVVKRCFEVILHAAPPGVPAVLMFSGGSKRGALQAQGTTMHAPDLLKAVGETTLVAFDKTGTLTGSAVSAHCNPLWSICYGCCCCCCPSGAAKCTQCMQAPLLQACLVHATCLWCVHPIERYRRRT